MIISNQLLDNAQWDDLNRLVDLVATADGGAPNYYPALLSKQRQAGSNYLFYSDNTEQPELLGFLAIFFFFENACELSVLVSPQYRRQGIAKALLNEVKPLIKLHQMQEIIVSTSDHFQADWLLLKGFQYKHSEYHMERFTLSPIMIKTPKLSMREANTEDIPTLCALDEVCFKEQDVDSFRRMQYLFSQKNYTILLAYLDGKAIGKAHVKWLDEKVLLSDIAIHPEHQRKGLGSELLAYCINLSLSKDMFHLALDVESDNQHALQLYRHHGFEVTKAYNYWRIQLKAFAY